MRLEKQVGLDVGTLQVVLVNWDRHQVCQGLVQDVFVVAYGESSKLLRLRKDVDDLIHGCFLEEASVELRDSDVRQVVEGAEVSKMGRLNRIIATIELDAACISKLQKVSVDESPEVGIDRVSIVTLELVKGRVLCESAEEVCPGEVVQTVLPLRESSRGDFCIQMICQLASQAALNREWLIKELLVEVLLLLRDHDACDTVVIEARSTCTTNHLEKIGEGEVNVALSLRIEELGSFDDDESGWEVDTPGQRRGRHQDLDLLLDKEVFNDLAVALLETGMMHTHTELDRMLQVIVLDVLR